MHMFSSSEECLHACDLTPLSYMGEMNGSGCDPFVAGAAKEQRSG